MEEINQSGINTIIINEVQLILAEKRTSLSVMRTGIAVLALPLSVFSVLIATSKYYNVFHVMHLLLILDIYLIVRSIFRMLHFDRHIRQIKQKHRLLAAFLD